GHVCPELYNAVLFPDTFTLSLFTVGIIIIRRMCCKPGRHRFDQCPAVSFGCTFPGFLHCLVDCDRVVTVYMFTVHAVTYGPVGKFFSPVLQLPWHTDCIFVVLYDAYEWQIMNADKVQTFVKITLIGRTFTECRHCNTRFVVHLELEAR